MSAFKEFWSELTPKGKVCVALLLPLAIVGIAFVAHGLLAEKGCAAVVGFWGHVGVGAQALVLGLFMACMAAGLIRAILGTPEIAEAARGRLEVHRAKKAWEIEHFGHILSKVEWKPAVRIVLIILAVGAVVVLLGSGIGYIAWLLSC